MRSGIFAAILFFGFALAIGVFAGSESWKGVIYLTDAKFLTGNTRKPAAIRRDLDFSRLDGAELVTASQKRLITAARTILQNDDVGVELGHFVTRGPDGEKKLACPDYYDHVLLRFTADGIAESGEKPVMEIESPCRAANDITQIEAVWIPVQKIMGERAANMDLSFPEASDVKFKFDNMGTSWPRRWALQSVKLFSQNDSAREVSISDRELRELRSKPLVVTWPEPEAGH